MWYHSHQSLSYGVSNISHIQLLLSDFSDGASEPEKVIAERLLADNKPYHVNKGLVLLVNNYFELVRPICPVCGSDRFKSKAISYRNKIKLCIYFTKFKEIFRIYDLNVAIDRLNKLLDKYNDIPRVLQKWIRKRSFHSSNNSLSS